MVSTKCCCQGKCSSDSIFPEKLPKSQKEMAKTGKKIFIPFPKPSQGIERCQLWINTCSREHFTAKNITRITYICALHWPDEMGPTKEFPDPLIKANLSVKDIEEQLRRKRKPPKQRIEPIDVKKAKLELREDSIEKEENQLHNDINDGIEVVKMANDKSTQTLCSKVELASKIETMILKNKLKMSTKNTDSRIVSNLSYEVIGKDLQLMKHFTGFTNLQFNVLFEFLNDICPLDKLTYWSCRLPEWYSKEKLFICLLRLKKRFYNKNPFNHRTKLQESVNGNMAETC